MQILILRVLRQERNDVHLLPERLQVHLEILRKAMLIQLTVWRGRWSSNEVFRIKIKFDLVVIICCKYYHSTHHPEEISPD